MVQRGYQYEIHMIVFIMVQRGYQYENNHVNFGNWSQFVIDNDNKTKINNQQFERQNKVTHHSKNIIKY